MAKILFLSFLVAVTTLVTQGCSVVQATSGASAKDLSVVAVGAHRYTVLGELGQPLLTEKRDDGTKVDLFKFLQGQVAGARAGKAFLYGMAAVGTLGISELVTSPLEGALGKGAEMQMKVGYDNEDKVNEIVVLEDDRWVPLHEIRERRKSLEN